MTKQLDAIPKLMPLYAAAAAGTKKKRPKSIEVKQPTLSVSNVEIDRRRDEKFRHLVGAPLRDEAFFGHVHALLMPIQMKLMAADDFPLPMMGLVHTENSYRQVSPIAIGGRVDLRVEVTGFKAHRAGTEVILTSTVTATKSGALLAEEESVYLAKGIRLPESDGFEEVEKQRAAVKEGRETIRREAFHVPVPTAQWQLPGDTGRKWAAVSGDWNPIHITNVSAKALGMPGAIAHGMYTASRALAESDVAAGEPFEFKISFSAPVVLPAKVNVAITRAGEVLDNRNGRGGMNIVAWDRKKKRPHFTGTVRDL